VYAFGDKGILGKVLTIVGFVYAGFCIFVQMVLRRCPNCLHHFSRYVFDPRECPYCGVKLRE